MQYDLEDRCIKFSNSIINFCEPLFKITKYQSIANQLVRSATSIGANYCEANSSISKKDFRNKIHISKKEAQETRYWLRILDNQLNNDETKILLEEIQQLIKIFATIAEKSK